MEARKSFYDKELDIDRAQEMMAQLCKTCTLKEILWIIRNVSYDMVAYYDSEHKGIVYNESYSDLNKEQANNLQRQLSTICDLFGQSVVDKREFEPGYLQTYEFAGVYLNIINNLKERLNGSEE